MSEENRKPAGEISEAELTGVSGGEGGEDRYTVLARDICRVCTGKQTDPHHCAAKHEFSLGPYLKKHGVDSVHKGNYKTNCPFYNL